MSLFGYFHRRAAVLAGTVLLSVGIAAHADDMADASSLFKQGQYGSALQKIDSYLASNPSDAQARFLKGLILTEQSQIDSAIAVFSALTEDYPELPEPYNNLAVLYASQENYDKARNALEMAIRTHPSYSTAHENLGDIYAKMASEAYDRALELDGGNRATQNKLAMIQDLFAGASSGSSAARSSRSQAAPAPVVPDTAPVSLDGEQQAVWSTIESWASAWSAQDVSRYLSFYSPDFVPTDGLARADWEVQRHERLSRPKFIQVTVSKPNIIMTSSNRAEVRFRQAYKASHYKTSGWKTLHMAMIGGQWMIEREISR